MKQREIFITEFDRDRLEELIEVAEEFGGRDRKDLRDLQEELDRAQIVKPQEVPPNVVTMNSRVLLRDMDTSDKMTCTLVFPRNANIDSGAISVLAPVGTAILGYTEGSVVEWKVPSGKKKISIEKILYQPEASGHFDL